MLLNFVMKFCGRTSGSATDRKVMVMAFDTTNSLNIVSVYPGLLWCVLPSKNERVLTRSSHLDDVPVNLPVLNENLECIATGRNHVTNNR